MSLDLDLGSLSQPMGSPLFDSPHVTLHRNRNVEVRDTGAGSGAGSVPPSTDTTLSGAGSVPPSTARPGRGPSLPTLGSDTFADTLLDIPEESQLDFQDGQFPFDPLEVPSSGSKASNELEEGSPPRAGGVATPGVRPFLQRCGSWELSPGGSLPELSAWESREVLSNIDNSAIVVDTPTPLEVESGQDFWLTATCFSKGELYCLKFKTSSMRVRAASLKPAAQARDRTRSPPLPRHHRRWRRLPGPVSIESDDEGDST